MNTNPNENKSILSIQMFHKSSTFVDIMNYVVEKNERFNLIKSHGENSNMAIFAFKFHRYAQISFSTAQITLKVA